MKKMFIIILVIVFSCFTMSPVFSATSKKADMSDEERIAAICGIILFFCIIGALNRSGRNLVATNDEQKEKSKYMPEFKLAVQKSTLPYELYDKSSEQGIPALKATWRW